MKAWLLDEPRTPLRLADVPTPEPGPGQVLVKVHGAGLCHSDVAYYEGTFPFQVPLPVILGHEVSGEVVALGEGVTGFAVGDRVASAPSAMDAPGISRDGGYAEYTLLTASKTITFPDTVPWAQASAATDAGLTSYSGVVEHGGAKPGDRIGVVGLGGLGLTGARIGVLSGATVYGVEPREDVWAIATKNGVTQVVADVAEYAGQDFDAVIDFAGFDSTITGSLRAVKPGGTVVVVGLGGDAVTLNPMELVSRNVGLRGSTPSGNPEHLRALLDWVASEDLHLEVTEINFADIPDGLARLARGEVKGRLVAVS